MTSSSRVRVPKTAEVVAAGLRGQIVRGEIAEGESLPSEAELMAKFQISRPSLREAFRILEHERLITVRRGSRGGAQATRPEISVVARYLATMMQFEDVELQDVFEARTLIEPVALRLLASAPRPEKAAEELLDLLRAGLEASETAEDRADVWLHFYTRMFELTGNKTVTMMYGALTEIVHRELVASLASSRDLTGDGLVIKAVTKAMDFVARGQGAEAADFWRDQMVRSTTKAVDRRRQKRFVNSESLNGNEGGLPGL